MDREIIPRTITGIEQSSEPASSSNTKILVVTGILAAGAILYVMKSDVTSQKEYSERYGLGGRRSAAYRRRV